MSTSPRGAFGRSRHALPAMLRRWLHWRNRWRHLTSSCASRLPLPSVRNPCLLRSPRRLRLRRPHRLPRHRRFHRRPPSFLGRQRLPSAGCLRLRLFPRRLSPLCPPWSPCRLHRLHRLRRCSLGLILCRVTSRLASTRTRVSPFGSWVALLLLLFLLPRRRETSEGGGACPASTPRRKFRVSKLRIIGLSLRPPCGRLEPPLRTCALPACFGRCAAASATVAKRRARVRPWRVSYRRVASPVREPVPRALWGGRASTVFVAADVSPAACSLSPPRARGSWAATAGA